MIYKPRSFIFVSFTVACASALSLLGGIGLEAVATRILPLVPLLIAIPGLNDLVGDYASIIAAHHGGPNETKKTKKELFKAIFRVVGINVGFLILMSLVLASLRGYFLEPVFIAKFVLFIAGAVVLMIFMMFAVASFLEIALKNRRINPDELLIPITTSLADVFMLLLVTLSALTIF